MSNLPTDLPSSRRVPFERLNQVHLSDRTKTTSPNLIRDESLQNFLYEHLQTRVRLCSKYNQCKRRFCPWCCSRVRSTDRARLLERTLRYETVLMFTCSVQSDQSLREAMRDSDAVLRKFFEGGWLTRRVDGWYRQREITHSEATGWHVHWHLLLFSETSLSTAGRRKLEGDLVHRWLTAAMMKGAIASPSGQKLVEYSGRPEVRRAVLYVTKGLLHQKPGDRDFLGRSPGDLLALAHQAGDYDALEHLLEVEQACMAKRWRWQDSGGSLRGARAPHAGES